MYVGGIKSDIRVNLSNIIGWRTNRHIIVIESDDWGSIRMASKEVYNELLNKGIPVDTDHYNIYDSLESNDDLEMLFHVLSKFKDKSGRPPVLTGVNVVANPNFDEILKNGFTEYVYEPYTETCERYPNHDQVYNLWISGIEKRLFVPIFHGREHLNVQFWMRALQNGHKSTMIAFNYGVTGIPRKGINGEYVPNFQAAFDVERKDDIIYQKEVINSGLNLFEKLYGYKSKYFVPTNGPFNNSLEQDLFQNGVEFINTAKRQKEPMGEGVYRTNTRFVGQQNRYNQIYITRNCFFEPSSSGYEWPENSDWINNCLKEIEIAFRWKKPAVISSHRVNYIGYLHPENREKNLKLLSELLFKILKNWPDVEFVTSVELGELISKDKNK